LRADRHFPAGADRLLSRLQPVSGRGHPATDSSAERIIARIEPLANAALAEARAAGAGI